MKKSALRIAAMTRPQIPSCQVITAVSEPWKTLGEEIDFKEYIAKKQAYVCTAGKKTAGFIIFTPEPIFARGGYLRAIGVAPGMRRLGIGRKLMAFAEKLTARSAQNLFLCVSNFNRKGQRFYEHLGYTRVGKLPALITPGKSEYIYWKKLDNLRFR